jgi:hypothetical protein
MECEESLVGIFRSLLAVIDRGIEIWIDPCCELSRGIEIALCDHEPTDDVFLV